MINLLVVGLWLTFLICIVGLILYSKVKKVHEKVRSTLSGKSEAQVFREAKDYREKYEIALVFLNLADEKVEEFEEETKKLRATLVKKNDQMEKLYLQTISLQEDLEREQEKSLSSPIIEEWVQYFPINKKYPTILETWVSSLGTIKNIYINKTTYSHFSREYNNHAFDRMQLSLLIAKCFLIPKDENDLVIVIDKTKAITIENILYIDAMESKFLTKTFGVSQKSKNCFAAVYRQNNLGYHKTAEEAQKVVYDYRKQWLIDNDRVEWLDLWKPNFITENN